MEIFNWRENCNVNTYNLEIGNYQFIIKSSKKLFLSDYNNIDKNEDLPKISIIIWLEDSQELRKNFLISCKNKDKIIPKELTIFYEQCNELLENHYETRNKFNEYYQDNKEYYLCFRYVTDEFFVYYKEGENEIFVIGNENNLERIIIDFLTVSSRTLPLHAVALKSQNGLGIGVLGDSKSGKTSFMIKLLERGCYFLADDALFIDENKNLVRVNTTFSYRKEHPNNFKLEEYSKKINSDKIIINFKLAKELINLKYIDKIEKYNFFKLNNINKIEKLKEPFPCISKNSFWCLSFLVREKQCKYIHKLLKRSIYEWNNILLTSKFIKIDFQNLNEYTDKFIKSINRGE